MRWVGGVEIELLAMATGARIVPRFEVLHLLMRKQSLSLSEVTVPLWPSDAKALAPVANMRLHTSLTFSWLILA